MAWKKLTSIVVYDNPWMTVFEDRVINPNGGLNDYGHIRFKNRAIVIVPIDDDGNTWIVGQHRYTIGEYSWEVPMGGAEKDEDPLDAAKRELREETGLRAKSWEQVLRVRVSNSITDEEGLIYVARDLTQGETDFDDSEDLEIRMLPFTDALEMAGNGEIDDLLSIAALQRVAQLL